MEARPYQVKCLDAMADAAKRGVTRQLVVMATGLGKTVCVAKFAERLGFPKTYGLMHRDELLKQARNQFLEVKRDLKIGLDKAELRPDPSSDDVILASVQSVGRVEGHRLAEVPKEWPRLAWIDEVHHAPSASYLAVLDHFGLRGSEPRRDILAVGTTATPDRLDALGYDAIFDDVVFRYGLREGIRDGWLSDIKAWRIRSGLDLSGVTVRRGDFSEKELAAVMNVNPYNRLAAETWAAHCRGRRSLVFCVTKEHAHAVRDEFEKAGAKAAVVIAETDPNRRAGTVRALKDGSLEAIVNVGVFTEGFDLPEIDCIHILRPTKSRALYTQMIGRGTRTAPGKPFMELFDHIGIGHDICSISQIFGLPDSWDLDGNMVEEDTEALEEAVADLGLSVDGLKGLADLQVKLKSREHRITLIKNALTAADLPSSLVWVKPSGDERYIIAWRNETREEVDRMKLEYQFAALSAMESTNLFGIAERIEVWKNELGKYEGRIFRRLDGQVAEHPMGSDASLARLVGKLESWISEKRPHKVGLMKKSARWAKQPASDAQLEILKKKGIPESFLSDGALTKREASILMGLPRRRIQVLFGNVF